MIIQLKKFFYLMAMSVIVISYTGTHFSDSVTVSGNAFQTGTWEIPPPPPGEMVINECMINPSGTESIGEWVELYNRGGSPVDVNGWYLYDAVDTHALEITPSNVSGGVTVVGAGGYLVVNRNGDTDFSLNNGADSVRLFNGPIISGLLIDSFIYTNNTIEDKTWSKVPDGTGSWQINRIPTPGGSNA